MAMMLNKAIDLLDLLKALDVTGYVSHEGEYTDRDWCYDILDWYGVEYEL